MPFDQDDSIDTLDKTRATDCIFVNRVEAILDFTVGTFCKSLKPLSDGDEPADEILADNIVKVFKVAFGGEVPAVSRCYAMVKLDLPAVNDSFQIRVC